MANIKKIEGKTGVVYKITASLGYDKEGKQIRRYMTWRPAPKMARTKADKESERIAWKFEEDLKNGYQANSKMTVEDYSAYYVELMRLKGDRPQTVGRIRRELDRFCKLYGNIKMSLIKPQHITNFIKECESLGARKWNIRAKPIKDFNDLKSFRSYAEFGKVLGIDPRIVKNLCYGEYITADTAKKIEKALNRKDLFEIIGDNSPLSPGTINNNLTTLWSMFEQAKRERLLKYNPVDAIPRPKNKKVREVRAIEPEELRQILKCADMERNDFRTMIYIMACIGCRKGEMLALTWNDIDLENKVLYINKSLAYTKEKGHFIGDTKTGEHREVPLPEKLLRVLKEYKVYSKWSGASSEYLFQGTRGGFYSGTCLNIQVTKFQKKYNFGRLTPHIFRHSCASILLAEGVDAVTVADMLGHKIETLFDTYAHVIKEHQRDTSDVMENILSGKVINI